MNLTMKFILMRIEKINLVPGLLLNLLMLLILSGSAGLMQAQIPDPSDPPRLVNDFANILSSNERENLEQQLVHYDDSTSTQIVVVTVRELGNYDISEFSYELGDQWGVGQAGEDNGCLISIYDKDRQVFISSDL